MQQPGKNRGGRHKRRREGGGEQQPLTNESAIGLQSRKRSKKSNFSLPPSAIDPNYVPGKNPQYADLDADEVESQPVQPDVPELEERQPQHSHGAQVTTEGRGRHHEQRGRKRRPKPHGRHGGGPSGGVEGRQPSEQDGRGDRPKGRRPHGRKQRGQRPHGEHRHAQHGPGGGSQTERQPGDRPQEERRRGRHPQGERRQGGQQRPHGERRQGQRPPGEHRQGPRPQGERPQGQRPRGPRPQGQPLSSGFPGDETWNGDGRTRQRPGRRGPGKGQQQRAKGRRGKGLGLAKKGQNGAPGRSKVYTSDMFIYKENLVPDKPVERKLRSRRNKPSDEPPTES